MSGSSVAAMVVGTVFIMVFGMATVSLVESVDESIKNAEFTLPNPQVVLTTVTDQVESDGPVFSVSLNSGGTGYIDGQTYVTTGGLGTGYTLSVDVTGGAVTGPQATITAGNNYQVGDVLTLVGGGSGGDATVTVDILDETNTITIKNTGSETVDLDHIFITLSDTVDDIQGTPFKFTSEYSGSNLFLFPDEELSTDNFPLDSTEHGFALEDDPNRAFLAIYDYNDAISVTIT